MKKRSRMMLVVLCGSTIVVGTTIGCSDDGAKSSDDAASGPRPDSGGGAQLDWFSSDCAALGGVLSPKGACYVDCSAGTPCPAGTVCGYGSAVHRFCKIPYEVCSADTDCGPQGWYCNDDGACHLPCSEKTSEQSAECPTGMSCEGSFCIQGISAPSTCPKGCQHPADPSLCCQPPFCTGDCAGSPCC